MGMCSSWLGDVGVGTPSVTVVAPAGLERAAFAAGSLSSLDETPEARRERIGSREIRADL